MSRVEEEKAENAAKAAETRRNKKNAEKKEKEEKAAEKKARAVEETQIAALPWIQLVRYLLLLLSKNPVTDVSKFTPKVIRESRMCKSNGETFFSYLMRVFQIIDKSDLIAYPFSSEIAYHIISSGIPHIQSGEIVYVEYYTNPKLSQDTQDIHVGLQSFNKRQLLNGSKSIEPGVYVNVDGIWVFDKNISTCHLIFKYPAMIEWIRVAEGCVMCDHIGVGKQTGRIFICGYCIQFHDQGKTNFKIFLGLDGLTFTSLNSKGEILLAIRCINLPNISISSIFHKLTEKNYNKYDNSWGVRKCQECKKNFEGKENCPCVFKSQIGDGDKSQIGDGDKSQIGDGDKSQIGDGDKSQIGDGDKSQIGDGDKSQIDDGDKSQIGDGDKSQIDDGDKSQIGDGDKSQIGDGDNSQIGDGDNSHKSSASAKVSSASAKVSSTSAEVSSASAGMSSASAGGSSSNESRADEYHEIKTKMREYLSESQGRYCDCCHGKLESDKPCFITWSSELSSVFDLAHSELSFNELPKAIQNILRAKSVLKVLPE